MVIFLDLNCDFRVAFGPGRDGPGAGRPEFYFVASKVSVRFAEIFSELVRNYILSPAKNAYVGGRFHLVKHRGQPGQSGVFSKKSR